MKQQIIDELNKAETFVVITEDSLAFHGTIMMVAALLATACERDSNFYEAMKLSIDAFNDYQLSKN